MATVYQSANGQWIVFNNDIKTFFSTQAEAENMATKLTFATQAQSDATTLAALGESLDAVVGVYFDRGYDSGGSDPIADIDIESLSITAADLAAMVTLAQQLANFLGNAAVATADYQATINTIRTDL